jgi:acyl CoA:acetate/3-ketoacid CoA transferase beta subunit
LHLAGAGPLIVAGIGVALSHGTGGRTGRVVPWVVTGIAIAFAGFTATRAPRFGSSQTMLLETAPGVDVEQVRAATSAHFDVSPDLAAMALD